MACSDPYGTEREGCLTGGVHRFEMSRACSVRVGVVSLVGFVEDAGAEG